MHPILIKTDWLTIQSYGVLLAISFVLGIALAVRRAAKSGISQKFVLDLSVLIVISSLIGARFLYVIYHLDEFRGHWLDMVSPFQSSGEFGIAGLTFLGGLIGAIIASIAYSKAKGYPFLLVADIFTPSIAAGLILVRVGCYLNGCCYGVPAPESVWGVVFPFDSPAGAANPGLAIYPTQLFSSFGGAVIVGILFLIEIKKRPVGFIFYSFLPLYGLHRLLIDSFRYYEPSMVLTHISSHGFSVNQGISIILILIGTAGLLFSRGKVSKERSQESGVRIQEN